MPTNHVSLDECVLCCMRPAEDFFDEYLTRVSHAKSRIFLLGCLQLCSSCRLYWRDHKHVHFRESYRRSVLEAARARKVRAELEHDCRMMALASKH